MFTFANAIREPENAGSRETCSPNEDLGDKARRMPLSWGGCLCSNIHVSGRAQNSRKKAGARPAWGLKSKFFTPKYAVIRLQGA